MATLYISEERATADIRKAREAFSPLDTVSIVAVDHFGVEGYRIQATSPKGNFNGYY